MSKSFVSKAAIYEDVFEAWKHSEDYKQYVFYCNFYNKFCVSIEEYNRLFKIIDKVYFDIGENLPQNEIEDFIQFNFSLEHKQNGWTNPQFHDYLRLEYYEI
jgi:hypothetical protein